MNTITVFVGPSLTREDRRVFPDIRFLGPAAQGDILREMRNSPSKIGLIDGYFGDRLAVHQKEILEAMATGIQVFGGASMGALRAAELFSFGMHGVGAIFEAYKNGEIESDADVAIAHAPEELDYVATSISLVDVRATVAALRRRRVMASRELEMVVEAAASIHYSERTWREISTHVHEAEPAARRLEEALSTSKIQQKRLDAIELLQKLGLRQEPRIASSIVPPMTTYYQRIRSRALGTAL